ncbi:MAG: hypothetical protein JNM93_11190 [Bacteriovoracaceae bacterium]|nr:hypothetical protein [Bacteriovoracaceae bacterium]
MINFELKAVATEDKSVTLTYKFLADIINTGEAITWIRNFEAKLSTSESGTKVTEVNEFDGTMQIGKN